MLQALGVLHKLRIHSVLFDIPDISPVEIHRNDFLRNVIALTYRAKEFSHLLCFLGVQSTASFSLNNADILNLYSLANDDEFLAANSGHYTSFGIKFLEHDKLIVR